MSNIINTEDLSLETLHSIIKDLQKTNTQLKRDQSVLKIKLETMENDMIHKSKNTNEEKYISQWIEQCLEPSDNILAEDGITKIAPSQFRSLYDNFSEWCFDVIGLSSKQIPDMNTVKSYLKQWQEKSEYGLHCGKRKDKAGVNGYLANMRFNLIPC